MSILRRDHDNRYPRKSRVMNYSTGTRTFPPLSTGESANPVLGLELAVGVFRPEENGRNPNHSPVGKLLEDDPVGPTFLHKRPFQLGARSAFMLLHWDSSRSSNSLRVAGVPAAHGSRKSWS